MGGLWIRLTQYYMGGCSYNKDWSNRFSYSWMSTTHTLTLSFKPDSPSGDQFTTTVRVIASEGDYFDMQMTAQEHYS